MNIGKIRQSMDFHEETHLEWAGGFATFRLYVTKRSGTYGHQFACCVWSSGLPGGKEFADACSDKTTGCGYSKDGAAYAGAVKNLILEAYGKEAEEKAWEAYRKIEGWGSRALAEVLGVKDFLTLDHKAHG